ncbi:MAG: carotenoid 1,2-hydratase [Bacteroidetes bacterium]|nr:carotenoid 1,2-hydratase [Bacteroidota bacterium]
MRLLLLSLVTVIILSGVLWFVLNLEGERGEAELTVSSVMSAESKGFKKADSIISFNFPEDHFAHYDYKTEWWYFTGNLKTATGRRFGYQFTIFRNGIVPGKEDDSLGFQTGSVYSAHLGLSDITTGKFYSAEKFARGTGALAGSDPEKGRIHIEGFELNFDFKTGSSKPKISIFARSREFEFSFSLEPQKEMVLQGEKGLSRKSNNPGNASYYYSFTRIATSGQLKTGGESHALEGWSWMDHEWSTSALEPDQKGWDWFALQLDDNSELMYFRLRDKDGNTNFQKGSLVKADGTSKTLRNEELKFRVTNTVTIEKNVYPSAWEIEVDSEKTIYKISTSMKNQLHKFRITYYEGAVDIEKIKGTTIKGSGYVELTGYGD